MRLLGGDWITHVIDFIVYIRLPVILLILIHNLEFTSQDPGTFNDGPEMGRNQTDVGYNGLIPLQYRFIVACFSGQFVSVTVINW